jgi:hypothetical protein
MINFRSYLTTANVMLFAFILVAEAAKAIFMVTRREPSTGYELLRTFGYLYVIGYWLQVDDRRHGFKWPYCRGVFLYLAGIFLLPYYLFKTRGKKGFLTLIIFASMYAISMLLGALAAGLLLAPDFG